MELQFDIATKADAKALTALSIAAFHSDSSVGGRDAHGPQGYDSVEFHLQMINESSKFYKILHNDRIIGGVWFFYENSAAAYLYRVFIDPHYHGKGLGLETFNFLFKSFPDIKVWRLRTPTWNRRTKKFYQKVGFQLIEQTDRFCFFSRKTGSLHEV